MKRRSQALLWCLMTSLVVLAGCRKEPRPENVAPFGSQSTAGTTAPQPRDAGSAGGSADSGMAGTDGGAGSAGASGNAGTGGSGHTDLDAGVDAGPLPPAPSFTKQALLNAIADCALAQYAEFQAEADALVDATAAYEADRSGANHDAARDAWRSAMRSWQRAELFRFGPVAPPAEPGGAGKRTEIYTFPQVNACLVDQQLVNQRYDQATFPTAFASSRDLSALEYLLFYTGSNNACIPGSAINVNGMWAALSADDRQTRRAAYAARAAVEVRKHARELFDLWSASGGDFEGSFRKAGQGSSVYAQNQDAFNSISHGLFYVEKEVKDWKLAWPLGLIADCTHAPGTCPDEVESRYANVSTDHLRQNLIGFRLLFEGCGLMHGSYWGLGFDDWLVAANQADLASDMLSALYAAQSAVNDLNPPLEQAIVSDPNKVAAVHAAIKALTDLLKTDFLTVLDFDRPAGTVGDND